MTGIAVASRLEDGDRAARLARARESLFSAGYTSAELAGMPDDEIVALASSLGAMRRLEVAGRS